MVNSLVAGLDPAQHGFEPPNDLYEHICSNLRVGGWHITADEEFMWQDIQNCSSDQEYEQKELKEFLDWLRTVDMTHLRQESQQPPLTLESCPLSKIFT